MKGFPTFGVSVRHLGHLPVTLRLFPDTQGKFPSHKECECDTRGQSPTPGAGVGHRNRVKLDIASQPI